MEKKPRLWEVWAESEIKAKKHQSFAIFLGILLAVETCSLGFYLIKPKPIYYINAVQGFASPIKTNNEMVKDFAEGFISNLANYTPLTIDKTYKEISNMVSPACLASMKGYLLKEKEAIQSNAVSSLFAITSIEIKKENNNWKIKIQGQHSLYIGGQEIKSGKYQYNLKIIKTTPTSGNPYGLIIAHISGRFISKTEEVNP